ncbi:MAG: hypothetical protein ABI603_09420 [Acidobacteriota bacterium]
MQCPSCRSARVFPSQPRHALERLRRRLSDQQPYRCHQCGWRKWRDVELHPHSPDVDPDDLRTGRTPQPVSANDLDLLDVPPTDPA